LIRAVVWKEFRDLSRDRKTLVIIVALPLITLPLLGFVTFYFNREQPAIIAIVDLDMTPLSKRFVSELKTWMAAYADSFEQKIIIHETTDVAGALSNTSIDYVVILDKGFSSNLTDLTRIAYVIASKRVETVRAQTADTIVSLSLNSLSKKYAEKRVSKLSAIAKLEVSPDTILEPVRKLAQVHKGRGAPASPEDELKFYTVRFLAFALLFVVMPTITYISDAIMGEKERKTFESLLATPIRIRDVLLGKIIASGTLGVLASIADIVGVIIYFYFLQLTFGTSQLKLDPLIVIFHSIDVAFTVLVTVIMVIPFVIRANSVRSANITASAITGIAMIIFFASLFTDINRLPSSIYLPLMLLPYTHSVAALTNFVATNYADAFLHLLALIAFSALFFTISVKMFNRERILMPPSRTD